MVAVDSYVQINTVLCVGKLNYFLLYSDYTPLFIYLLAVNEGLPIIFINQLKFIQ